VADKASREVTKRTIVEDYVMYGFEICGWVMCVLEEKTTKCTGKDWEIGGIEFS